ncbi:MAG: hypothetical protein ACYDGR_05475 [Candidatus Dormibacteria bacterium]
MTTSISALQRNAASVIHRVAASGVTEEITHRGRVVAVLSPPPAATGLAGLRAAGLSRAADPDTLARALAVVASLPPVDLAGALSEQRDSDR